MKKAFYLVMMTLFLFSCSKENQGEAIRPETDVQIVNIDISKEDEIGIVPDSLHYLKDYLVNDLDFLEENIVFSDNMFILENDIIMTIESIKYSIQAQKENTTDPTAHREQGEVFVLESCSGRNCVSSSAKNIYNIAVYISNSLPATWRQATINAINNWNNLPNNKIRFYITNSAFCSRFQGIRVQTYSENNRTVYARAPLPNLGNPATPGEFIKINTNGTFYNENDIPRFTRVLTHEFGHTLGYRHTNQTNGSFINGSATVDPGSIMNSALISGWIGNGFSNADITAHNIKYPNASSPTKTFTFQCR